VRGDYNFPYSFKAARSAGRSRRRAALARRSGTHPMMKHDQRLKRLAAGGRAARFGPRVPDLDSMRVARLADHQG